MAAQPRKRPKAGDILEVSIDDGRAYLHYLGKHPEYGDAIRVLAGDVVPEDTRAFEALVAAGYVGFYPVVAAVSQGLVRVVGHREVTLGIPSKLRRAGARAKVGKVLTWIIENEGRERLVKRLSRRDKALPIAAIWNHEMLRSRLSQAWRPEQEG